MQLTLPSTIEPISSEHLAKSGMMQLLADTRIAIKDSFHRTKCQPDESGAVNWIIPEEGELRKLYDTVLFRGLDNLTCMDAYPSMFKSELENVMLAQARSTATP